MIITTCPQAWQDTGAYWVLKNLEITGKTKHVPWEQLLCFPLNPEGNAGNIIITCGLGEVDLLKLKKQKFKIGVLFCSPLAQAHVVPSSLNGDLDALLRYKNMLKSGNIDYIFLLSKSMVDIFKDDKIIYLPVPLKWELQPESSFDMKDRRGICFFGTMDRHKNLATMFGAVKSSGIEDPFIITGQEKKQMCIFFSNLFDMKNIMLYPRLPRQQLLNLMTTVKLGIQIGFSESFNYSTWELAMLGIPSIVSPSIKWYTSLDMTYEYCKVFNLDDPCLIAGMINRIYFDDALYKELCEKSKEVAISTMHKNNQQVQEILSGL